MAGRRRRSRVFVDVKAPLDTPAVGVEHTPSADESSPSFVITPIPQTTTQPMRVVPPRQRPPTSPERDA